MSEKTTTLQKSAISAETIVIVGIFTAIISVISALPIGFELFGVPATLQTFAMAFIGFILGQKLGVLSCTVYILMGLIGIPVFHRFMSGPSILFGPTGGFLFGFLALSFLSGLGISVSKSFKNSAQKAAIAILLSFTGLIICHLAGSLQFSVIYGTGFLKSMLLVSLPYLPKDIVSVILAYFIALAVRTALARAHLLPKSAI